VPNFYDYCCLLDNPLHTSLHVVSVPPFFFFSSACARCCWPHLFFLYPTQCIRFSFCLFLRSVRPLAFPVLVLTLTRRYDFSPPSFSRSFWLFKFTLLFKGPSLSGTGYRSAVSLSLEGPSVSFFVFNRHRPIIVSVGSPLNEVRRLWNETGKGRGKRGEDECQPLTAASGPFIERARHRCLSGEASVFF